MYQSSSAIKDHDPPIKEQRVKSIVSPIMTFSPSVVFSAFIPRTIDRFTLGENYPWSFPDYLNLPGKTS